MNYHDFGVVKPHISDVSFKTMKRILEVIVDDKWTNLFDRTIVSYESSYTEDSTDTEFEVVLYPMVGPREIWKCRVIFKTS